MASGSSSGSIPPPTRSWTYHVFLSFRGEDTRTGFTGHLYAALNRKGITTYKDDQNLRKGDVISKELLKAIEESMFAVIVFSPDYASSSWCLDELQKIIECKNQLGQQIEAVFYGVEPSDNLAGEQAWFGPGSRIIITTRDVEALKGPEVHETYEVEGLVESEALNLFCLKAFKQQKPTEGFLDLSKEVVKYSGGLPLALEVLGSYLNGRPIAVWYSAIERIKKTSHSEIIDVLKISYEGLEDTEKDIFLDIACFFKGDEKDGVTKKLKRCGHDAEIGIDILINKSLITIDIHGCLGMHDLLEEMGKQIVIQESPNDACNRSRLWCSEDVEFVLAQKEVHETYNVEGLMESEALNLFSLEAFNLPKPSEEFLDLSKEVVKEVVKYSGGLPLALQVLGSYLNGRPIVVWHSAIEKIKQFSHSEIIDVLKISFDGLDDMEKNIFLDIACFFKGYEKGNVTRILEGCGYQAELGLHILINRSLVTINKYDQLEMHDLLEEMGKRIVIQESPNDPSKRSRLWCYEDLNSVLAQKKVCVVFSQL
ncbi:hypothetical protein AHAS_Ahas04G0215900 [Arachis hypogaea]